MNRSVRLTVARFESIDQRPTADTAIVCALRYGFNWAERDSRN